MSCLHTLLDKSKQQGSCCAQLHLMRRFCTPFVPLYTSAEMLFLQFLTAAHTPQRKQIDSHPDQYAYSHIAKLGLAYTWCHAALACATAVKLLVTVVFEDCTFCILYTATQA